MNKVARLNHTVLYIVSLAYLFLFPLFFLPTTANFFETNKLALTVAMASVLLIFWGIDVISRRTLKLTITPFTLPLLVVGLSVIASVIFADNNRIEALLGRGSFIPALCLIAILVPFLIESKKFVTHALYALIGSGIVLSVISLSQSTPYQASKLFNRLFSTGVPHDLAFTPSGSPLALIVYLATMILVSLIIAFIIKANATRALLFFGSAIMGASLILLLIYSWPGKDTAPIFLPMEPGYIISLETLKDTKTALIGVGPESYANAYNRTRPAKLNLTPYWNVRFTNASNELFQTLTTLGVIGLVAWIIMAVTAVKTIKSGTVKPTGKVIQFATVTLLFLMIFIPGTYLYLFLLITFFMLWSLYLKFFQEGQVKQICMSLTGISLVRGDGTKETKTNNLTLVPFLIAIPMFILSAVCLTFASKAYAAEVVFKKALVAIANNQGVETYNLQRSAITQNPYLTRYRRAYAATNLALANSIAGKANLTDQDKQNITQLIQQAIREGKAAATLDPKNAANWENLTNIYKSLINVAQNADSWTVAALAQAIQNDPLNPRLRLELGGVYYSLGQYDQAIRYYQQAAELKPDWANAYYNLAAAHKLKKEFAPAYDYLSVAIRYIDANSADYTKVQTEMQELADQLNLKPADQTQTPPAQSDLVIPTPAPTANPTRAVNLSPESAPEGEPGIIPTTSPVETNPPQPINPNP